MLQTSNAVRTSSLAVNIVRLLYSHRGGEHTKLRLTFVQLPTHLSMYAVEHEDAGSIPAAAANFLVKAKNQNTPVSRFWRSLKDRRVVYIIPQQSTSAAIHLHPRYSLGAQNSRSVFISYSSSLLPNLPELTYEQANRYA